MGSIFAYLKYSNGLVKRAQRIGFAKMLKEYIEYYKKFSKLPAEMAFKAGIHYKMFTLYNYLKICYYVPNIPVEWMLNFIPRRFQIFLLSSINKNKLVMVNKIQFYQKLELEKIPYPKVHFYCKDDKVYDLMGNKIFKISCNEDLFEKSISGSAGCGSYIANQVDLQSIKRDFLYQSIVKAHPNIAKLAPGNALNTIRVHSYLCKDGSIEIQSAHIKLSTSGITDNIGTGGIGVRIDIKNGKLEKYGFSEIGVKRWYDIHPKGSVNFENFVIPFWGETIELLNRLHNLFPNIKSVGWDIAVTNKGPCVIEGNAGGDIFIPQLFIRPFLETKMIQENLK